MNLALFILGLGVITITLADTLRTTVIPHGSGPISGTVCRAS